MVVLIIFIVVMAIIFILAILNNKPRQIAKMYTKDGYPRADLLTLHFDKVPQGLDVVMSCTSSGLIFEGNGIVKEIPHKDIVDITLQTVDDKANISNFSYGKAIIGTAMLGTVGAVAGISGKKRQNLQMLIISYIKGDEIEHLTFLQQTKGDYPINTEAFFLKETIKRIEEVRVSGCIPFKYNNK